MINFMPYLVYLILLVILAYPLGMYIKKVMNNEKTFLSRIITPIEKLLYKLFNIDKDNEMDWKQYAKSVLVFSAICFVFLFLILLFQGYLPFNPQGMENVSMDLSFNTAISFITNTNWQSYAGESTLSYFSQFAGLTVQNFVSAAVGIAVLFALIRGFKYTLKNTIGNFFVDITKIILYILIPINIVISVALMSGGVMQNISASKEVSLIEPIAVDKQNNIIDNASVDIDKNIVYVDGKQIKDAKIITSQFMPMGPAASQIAIKQSGTNGGGYFGVNSAHPLENPNSFTNLIEMLSILLIPAALCFTFGKSMNNTKQGIAIFSSMFICLIIALSCIAVSEQFATPQLSSNGTVDISTTDQAGGNMEGKEARFGIAASSTWSAFTTAASSGSVNTMHDSLTPLGGMVCMLLIQLGEVIFGGVGTGLYSMLAFAILTVFIAGLMVGRTPEFLLKKIEPYEMKYAVIVCLASPIAILVGSGIAAMVPEVINSITNTGPHGFSQMLYAYSSAGGNNGSAFAGFICNTPFINISLALVMVFARFVPIVATLAIAGSLAKKKMLASSPGTLSTNNAMFVFLLIIVVLVIGALSFFPSLALGPLAEFFASVL